jgi:hypothetical protein
LAQNKKGDFRNQTINLHKKEPFFFSRIIRENVGRKDQTETKEVKTKENTETNLKIDLEVKARNRPSRSNSRIQSARYTSQKSPTIASRNWEESCHSLAGSNRIALSVG